MPVAPFVPFIVRHRNGVKYGLLLALLLGPGVEVPAPAAAVALGHSSSL